VIPAFMDIHAEAFRRDPYPTYDQMRAAAPVLHDPRSGLWLLFAFEDVKRALTDHDTFSSAVSASGTRTSQWLIFSDPPRHTRLRGLVLRTFTPRAVAALEQRIREIARRLLQNVVGRREFDLVGEFSIPLPLMVIAHLLGAPADDWPLFRAWSDVIVSLSHAVGGSPEAPQAVAAFTAAHGEMDAYLGELLRRPAPGDGLLARLGEAANDGDRLSHEELLGFFQLLLLAGHETTTNLIDNAMLCFDEFPSQCARLRRQPELLPSAVEEVLRYRSPVQATFRIAARDVEMGGRTIPTGSLVLAMIGSANRDPRRFRDSDIFAIDRTPNPHIAFGHGIHFCIGAPLARLETKVALDEILAHFRTFTIADDWIPREAFHVHGPTRLTMRVET
jgi:cytochrome P450